MDTHHAPAAGTTAIASGHEQVWHVQVEAGRRYRVLIDSQDPGGEQRMLHATVGPPWGEGSLWTSASLEQPIVLSLLPSASGLHDIRVVLTDANAAQHGNVDSAARYRIRVVEWPSDDHADSPILATPLTLGAALTGRVDDPADADCFVIDLYAGQAVRWSAVAAGDPAAAASLSLTVADPQGQAWTTATSDLAFVAPHDGAWVLRVNGAEGTDYTVRAERQPDQPTPSVLQPGDGLNGTLNITGEQQRFDITLSADERVDVHGAVLSGDGWQLGMHAVAETGGQVVYPSHEAATGQAVLRLDAQLSLRWQVVVNASDGAVDFRIDVHPVQADDHADGLTGATPVGLTTPVSGRLESVADTDWFTVDLQAGQAVDVGVAGDQAGLWLEVFGPDGWPVGVAPMQASDRPLVALPLTAEASGPHTLRVSSGVALSYALSVTPSEPDDHGDTAAQASAVALGEAVPVQVAGVADLDLFVFQAQAGVVYQWQVAAANEPMDAAALMFSVQQGAQVLWHAVGPGFQGLQLRAWSDGPVLLALQSAGAAGDLEMRVTEVVPDANGPAGPEIPVVEDLGFLAVDGHLVQGLNLAGTDGADHLLGTAGADRLDGGGGQDRLEGGAGDDRLVGGTGLDTAVYAGFHNDLLLLDTGDGLRVLDRLGIQGMDHLQDVERLAFDDGWQLLLANDPLAQTVWTWETLLLGPGVRDADFERQALGALRFPGQADGLQALVVAWAAPDFDASPEADIALLLSMAEHMPGVLQWPGEAEAWQRLYADDPFSSARLVMAMATGPVGQWAWAWTGLAEDAWLWLPPPG